MLLRAGLMEYPTAELVRQAIAIFLDIYDKKGGEK